MKKKSEIGKKIGIILSVVLTIGWLFPYIYVICCSFKPGSEVIAVPPSFFPKNFSVENFSGLLERMDVFKFLFNSLSTALLSTIIALILGSLAAYAIQRSGANLSILLVVLVLCLKMIPTSSIVVPIYELICNLGLYDTKIALILVYVAINMPFVMWTMLSFSEGIPSTLDEAAYIDGASSLQTFIDTFTNVVIIVDQYQFCAIVIDQLAPFFTDRIRHDDDRPITLYSSYQSKSDALISTGRLDDDRVLINDALFLCVADHIISGSRFDRTAHV